MLGKKKSSGPLKKEGAPKTSITETTLEVDATMETEPASPTFPEKIKYHPSFKIKGRILSDIPPDIQQKVLNITAAIQEAIVDQIDLHEITFLDKEQFLQLAKPIIDKVLSDEKISLNKNEELYLEYCILAEMLGYGPIQALLDDVSINDILINGFTKVYVERFGKLELTDISFRNDEHLMRLISQMVLKTGRRIDELNPYVDTRLPDGSRVNAIIPPLAIDGPSVSIRKFKQSMMHFSDMITTGSMSVAMSRVLEIAVRSKINILILGGTGCGKTTFLNALSQMIPNDERIVTIEDAAELQLQQPHLVRLETRTPNVEGEGEVTIRQLVINALRMRPDRIILGEIRGEESFEMLQAMNTGHNGSMCTIHASSTREVAARLSNMLMMLGYNFSNQSILSQIANSIQLLVELTRMKDGKRRVTKITEITGLEHDVITMQDLFVYQQSGEDKNGNLLGDFKVTKIKPRFSWRTILYGLDKELLEAMQ